MRDISRMIQISKGVMESDEMNFERKLVIIKDIPR